VWQCSQALFILEFARGPHIITPSDDPTQMNIEELMNVVVTSVSRHEQSLSKTAAIFVITEEDIRRSGANNIPDLLRMVPGVQVAEISAGSWAVGIRGFNGRFSDKVLVMVDGRCTCLPLAAAFTRFSTSPRADFTH
jgi:iron complex outermembrane receptor protein